MKEGSSGCKLGGVMEIWLDTSNVDFVKSVCNLGVLQGVTTNPSIVSLATLCPEDLIDSLLDSQHGLVAVQVLANEAKEMCKQARSLSSISNRIVVKIPVTKEGLRAIYALNQEGIQTLATAIFAPHQALLAFKVGAKYLAPYLGRIADTGSDPIQALEQMRHLKSQYGFNGKIMAAGIRDLATVMACVHMGICAVTLPEKIFQELIEDHQPTLQAVHKFTEDWNGRDLSASSSVVLKRKAHCSLAL